MKLILLFALMLTSAFAVTERIVLLETQLPYTMDTLNSDAKFYMDTETGMGYADISVDEIRRVIYPGPIRCDRWGCYGGGYPNDQIIVRRIMSKRVEIPNLNLVDKELIYNGVDGEVNCGKLGRSRVLRRPTIFLSGNCQLKTYITNRNDLSVVFTTK